MTDYAYTPEGQKQKTEDAFVALQKCYEAQTRALQAALSLYAEGQFEEAEKALKLSKDVDRIKRNAAEQNLREGLGLLARPA